MASDGANVMRGDKNTAERLPAVTAPSHQQPSISVHEHLSEKLQPGSQSREKATSISACDMETGGVRPAAGKTSLFQNPFIWPYLGWVSIEVGGLINDYLLLKTLNRDYSKRVSHRVQEEKPVQGVSL